MLARRLGMSLSFSGVLASLFVLTFSVMLSGHAVTFRSFLVVIGCLVVGIFRHSNSPFAFRGIDKTRQRRTMFPERRGFWDNWLGLEEVRFERHCTGVTKTRRKIDAGLKTKIALEALRERATMTGAAPSSSPEPDLRLEGAAVGPFPAPRAQLQVSERRRAGDLPSRLSIIAPGVARTSAPRNKGQPQDILMPIPSRRDGECQAPRCSQSRARRTFLPTPYVRRRRWRCRNLFCARGDNAGARPSKGAGAGGDSRDVLSRGTA